MGKRPSSLFCWILILFLTIPASIYAGNEDQPTGARKISLGNAYTGVRNDFWALFANPAGIVGLDQVSVGLHLDRSYLLPELNYGAVGLVYPFMDRHYAGLDFSGFGFGDYNESRVGLTYAVKVVERLSLAVKANYALTSIQNYGSGSAFFLDIGINTAITENLTLGFRAYNVNQAELDKELGEKIPSVFDVGLAYQVSGKVLVVLDAEKHVNYPVSIRGGVEYAFVEKFKARVGISTEPVTINAGLGLALNQLNIDFASSFHEQLGFSPHLSLNYRFGKRKSETTETVEE